MMRMCEWGLVCMTMYQTVRSWTLAVQFLNFDEENKGSLADTYFQTFRRTFLMAALNLLEVQFLRLREHTISQYQEQIPDAHRVAASRAHRPIFALF